MSLVNIPVMGSAQDLRRQLRYSVSRRNRNKPGLSDGAVRNSNQDYILNDQRAAELSSYAVPRSEKIPTSLVTHLPTTKTTTSINSSASFTSRNNNHTSHNINSNPPGPYMSKSPRAHGHVPVGTSDSSHRHRQSSSYVPPPPASRNYRKTRESDGASQHSRYSTKNSNTAPTRKPSSVARSTASSHRQPTSSANANAARSRSRVPFPYHNLTLPDVPETTRNFPNSDPNSVTDTTLPVPSGYVGYTGHKVTASRARPRDLVGKAMASTSIPSRSSVSRHPRGPTSAVTSSNIAPQNHSHSQQRSSFRGGNTTASRTPSKLPFVPPNGVHSFPAGSKFLTRSPSRSRALPSNTLHVETSPSNATADSNTGPRIREGRPLPGLTARTGSPPPPSRNLSQNRTPLGQTVNRGRSLQRGGFLPQDPYLNQARNRGPSQVRPRSPSHPPPPPSTAASAAIPTPAPIPIPSPVTYSQTRAPSVSREAASRKGVPFPNVNKNRIRQVVGNYIPYPRTLRRNNINIRAPAGGRPQDPQFVGQDNYPTRPVQPDQSHIPPISDSYIPNGSIPMQDYPNGRSSPAVITRKPSHRSNLVANPNQSRSRSRQSRHSKHSRRSQSRQSRRSSHHGLSNRSMREHSNPRAPVHAVRIEEDNTATNRTSRKKRFKWKWPMTRSGMGKLFSLNPGLRPREPAQVVTSRDVRGGQTVEIVHGGLKRVRADSNSNLNWNLPQIKNLAVFKTRVRDLPPTVQSSLPSRPVLHSLLRPPALFRPARLRWDVRNLSLPPMSNEETAAMLKLLKEPATSPPTAHMRLLVRSPVPRRYQTRNTPTNPKYWEIDVTPSSAPSRKNPQPYIKCMDVIRAFGKMLRTSADASEFDSLDDMHQRLAIRVFEMRAAGVFEPHGVDAADLERVRAREIRKGYRKVDLLVNQTRWDGLQSTGTHINEWVVRLGHVPFNPF